MKCRTIAFSLSLWAGVAGLGCLCASSVGADGYAEARADVVAAYQAGEFSSMRNAARRALDERPDYPAALFNLALAEVLDGNPEAALQTLQALLGQDIDFGVENVPEFEPLRSLPGWLEYSKSVQRLAEPAGNAEIAFTLDVDDFVPEGIAIDTDGRLYLGSIRYGSIVRTGELTEYLSNADRHFAVFGMRLDGAGGLWFASANVPEHAGPLASTGARTGLYRLDLKTKEVRGRELQPGERPQVLGDLVFADANTVFTTESLTGALYRYSVDTGEYGAVLPAGTLGSPQGLVMDASGDFLYLADYIGGLFRLDLRDNALARVTSNKPSALFGIDGLYRDGDELIAIQNGIRPHRVVALQLSADGLAVTAIRTLARNLPEFDEPTLGQVVGSDFYFVANSHWNRFDREGNLPAGLNGPVVMRVSLRQ